MLASWQPWRRCKSTSHLDMAWGYAPCVPSLRIPAFRCLADLDAHMQFLVSLPGEVPVQTEMPYMHWSLKLASCYACSLPWDAVVLSHCSVTKCLLSMFQLLGVVMHCLPENNISTCCSSRAPSMTASRTQTAQVLQLAQTQVTWHL